MVLYTPVPLEDIFPADPAENSDFERYIDGRLCLVRRAGDGSLRLERLLSTNPDDYLDPRFSPNRLIM